MTAAPDIADVLGRISASLRAATVKDSAAGLLDGFGGGALFHAYHYRLTGDERELDHLHDVIARCVAALADPALPRSHCSGLVGIAWCLRHLITQGFIDADDSVFDDIDPIAFAELASPGRDFLHEGLGAMVYAIERLPDPRAIASIEAAIAALADAPDAPDFNLGLAHGAPAMISLVSLAYTRGVAAPQARALIRRLVDRVLATRNSAGEQAMFPSRVDAANQPIGPRSSRLGWCYGDLGIAIALHQAGSRLGDTDYTELAHAMFTHTAVHRDAVNGQIRDASLCHGSVGLSHIYRRAYHATRDPALLRCAESWLRHALDEASSGFHFHTRTGAVACHDVLQGVAGIGLGLIASIDQDAAWDRCLLLS